VGDRAGVVTNATAIGGGAIVTIVLIDLFPVIGLTLVSAALIIALALRSARVAAAAAVGSAVFAAMVLLQLARCDRTVQDCSYSPGITVIVGWMVTLTVIGAVAAVLISRRKAGAR
jgi:hypothetical protein